MTDLREQIETIVHKGSIGYRQTLATTDAIMALIGWRDMESAPRDGTCVLVVDAEGRHFVAQYLGMGERYGFDWFDGSGFCEPTHWTPLLQPPENTHLVQPAP